jgi:hypothetical protein
MRRPNNWHPQGAGRPSAHPGRPAGATAAWAAAGRVGHRPSQPATRRPGPAVGRGRRAGRDRPDLAGLGLDWDGIIEAVTQLHTRGQVKALEFAELSTEQVALLTAAPSVVDGAARALLRDRLRRRLLRARQRWHHPSRPGFGDGEPFL